MASRLTSAWGMKMKSQGMSLSVLVRGEGAPRETREYVAPGDGNHFIEGREGSEFILRIKNDTAKRVLAVPSVDGLSVIDGKKAGSSSSGFVLEPYGHVDVVGWLRDRDNAAAFYFAGMKDGKDDSYVARIDGDTDHKGVIGVMFFAEERIRGSLSDFKGGPMLVGSSAKGASASKGLGMLRSMSAGSLSADAQAQCLGAGYGRETGFATKSVAFRRGTEITRISLFYDDARGLKRRGIDVTRPTTKLPNPFPADIGCPAPSGWNG